MAANFQDPISPQDDIIALEDILGNVYLHIDWHFVTKKLTTEERERFADAVDAWSYRLNEGDPENQRPVAPRWWL